MPSLTSFRRLSLLHQGHEFPTAGGHQDPYEGHHERSGRPRGAKIGGKTQVPCLVIDGKPLYESLDIIEWLKTNYKG